MNELGLKRLGSEADLARHRAWIAYEAGLRGDLDTAYQEARRIEHAPMNAFHNRVRNFAVAMIEVQLAPKEQRHDAMVRAKRAFVPNPPGALTTRLHNAAAHRIARDVGTLDAYAWAYQHLWLPGVLLSFAGWLIWSFYRSWPAAVAVVLLPTAVWLFREIRRYRPR